MTSTRTPAAVSVDDLLSGIPLSDRMAVRLFATRAADSETDVAAIDAKTGRAFTYGELARAARRVSRELLAHGITAGHRVVWSAPTGVDAIAVWMGIAQIGAVDIAIGDALKGRVLHHVLSDCTPVAAITHAGLEHGLSGLAAERLQAFNTWLHIGSQTGFGANADPLDPWNGTDGDDPIPEGELRPDDAATIIYTSGTTGPSKGVILCHHHQFFAGANLAEQFRVHLSARLYHYSPFNHVSGRQLVIASMLVGGTLIMRERFRLDQFWPDINGHEVTHAVTLGSAVPLLMDQRGPEITNKGSLRYVWASPAMPKIYAEFAERFKLCVCSPYGSSEVGIVVAPALIPDDPGPSGNCGHRSKYFQLEILTGDDEVAPPDTVGEIAVRPIRPWTTFLGYLNRDAATVDATRNLWYHTGDLGRIDEDGYLFFVDRKQDFMRVKGENISSSELEQILVMHPGVADAAVVPVSSSLGEQDVLAVISTSRSGDAAFDIEGFFGWCADEMPHFMVPRYIRLVDDLPRGHSGKVEKHKLRADGPVAGTWDATAAGLRATRRGVIRIKS